MFIVRNKGFGLLDHRDLSSVTYRANKLNDDMLRGPVTERDAGATELTDERFLAGNFFDDGGLAKPDFPQALAKLGLAVQFAHATGGTDRPL
ncbi:MAG TPA: hypothetical protein VNV15_10260 [Opitutaceae bacterium]|jgi:hypothetical protein|nr:hypothetical protein [Opitutaceae bacterium]